MGIYTSRSRVQNGSEIDSKSELYLSSYYRNINSVHYLLCDDYPLPKVNMYSATPLSIGSCSPTLSSGQWLVGSGHGG